MRGGRVRLPATVGPPLLVQRLDAVELRLVPVAVDRADVRFELVERPGAGDDAVDAGLGQQPAQRGLGQRLPVALQEAELLDALEPELEPVAGRSAPLLLGRDRL